MLSLHPSILERDGKKAFAVLPYEEYEKLQEALSDFEDLKALREAKVREKDAAIDSLRSVRSALSI